MAYRRLALALLLMACGSKTPTPVDSGLPELPPLGSAALSTSQTWQPKHARESETQHSPDDIGSLAYLVDGGYGAVTVGPGLSVTTQTLDGTTPPASGPNRKLLMRFVHLADTQLADDESPARFVSSDAIGATSGAYRPQEAWGCHVLAAAVRSINALHRVSPIDFVITGGDNTDNSQTNELDWFISILDGAPSVECDSGNDDDPIPGPNNDPKDPFFAEGLAMPWRWVTGNHDVLNLGDFVIDDSSAATYTGTTALFGTRDWSHYGGPLSYAAVVADPRRAPLRRQAMMDAVGARGDGHGLKDAASRADGKAIYAIDSPHGPVRVIPLETPAETGGSDGVLHRTDVMTRVKPLLDDAESKGLYVILTSHHPPRSLGDGSDLGGTKQDDAMLPDEWRSFIAGYPHVVMHLAGHTHQFHTQVTTPDAGHPFYETESCSLTDWPSQMRVFEVWDEDNGQLRIRAIPFDYAQDGDAFAAEFRTRATADFTAGWAGSNITENGAVDFWFAKVP